ncbi:UDP-N-acetylmuramate--L-alanine ligase [Candidatus Arcticimaribacter forsetii]|uniref:UDP-N-acetylmuramate--L-alanine ligase n=1 Tax=Candidatus Arcticimaribacter forsetii TaxID=2820661 RepID=UPI002076F65A|nr:UDP-N-acetylmuramate--L-alanine ligase [Candidatus Arcticimaribacter forsetii]MDB2329431.1 UDP-N-acetylmuramate--L-alanine ligase [Flavobacteriaceae bacterium]MDB4674747.1 UDP-N-acetylmuramate--L-alanine ligase [Flavobacteriaceae bacterium]MDB4716832.1 UDP-N-acetylmuramate--L-alanine ligase [Flavobacteriaceae bacterium]
MNFKDQTYYFIGIGGIGMSSIARYLVLQEAQVFGYDKTPSAVTSSLESLGIQIVFNDLVDSLPKEVCSIKTQVVFTPAIPKNHAQLKYFENQGNQIMKRAELLGDLTRNTICLAVAGTHGKTTTTAILTHLFQQSEASFTAFVGGVFQDSKTNMLSSGSEYTLVEADEFDRSFLHLNPTIACITSIDADHLDIYGDASQMKESYAQFASQVKKTLFVEKGIPMAGLTYSVTEKADYYMDQIKPVSAGLEFTLHTPEGVFENQYFNQLGAHNLSNALAAISMASKAGIPVTDLVESLKTFPGVERRLQVLIDREDLVLIDDYAHHPTEIKAVYETLSTSFPDDEKCVVFQPHLFSRTQDFMTEFASVLSLFDRVFLLDIYPARELPIDGVDSEALKDLITINNVELITKEELGAKLSETQERIISILGAGDIGAEVSKIKEILI